MTILLENITFNNYINQPLVGWFNSDLYSESTKSKIFNDGLSHIKPNETILSIDRFEKLLISNNWDSPFDKISYSDYMFIFNSYDKQIQKLTNKFNNHYDSSIKLGYNLFNFNTEEELNNGKILKIENTKKITISKKYNDFYLANDDVLFQFKNIENLLFNDLILTAYPKLYSNIFNNVWINI